MSDIHQAEILQSRHHTGGVRIVCIDYQFIVHGFRQLRTIVMGNIRLQCFTNLSGRNTEEPTYRNGSQCIFHIIAADKVGMHFEFLSLMLPFKRKERSTGAKLATDVKAFTSFQSITNTGKPLRDSCDILIVLVDKNNMFAIVTQMVIQLAFGLDDSFERSETFQMCLTHIRDHTVIRFHDAGQRLDFTRMVRSHLDNSQLMLGSQPQQSQRNTDMVVQIPLCIKHLKPFLQHRSYQFLGSGLSVCTRDTDDTGSQLMPVIVSQFLQRFQAIVYQQDARITIGRIFFLVHHSILATFFQCLKRECISIECLPFQGYEHRALGAIATVGSHLAAFRKTLI